MMAIRRGDIYFANLNPVRGREQSGTRPVLVVSSDLVNALPLVVIVVVGTSGRNVTRDYLTNVRVSPDDSGLPEETVFLGFQVRSLDPARFVGNAAGQLNDAAMLRIDSALRYCLELY